MSDGVKKPWLSKTLWVNLIAAAFAFFPGLGVSVWIQAHAAEVTMIMAGINMLLRLITKDKVSIVD